MSKKPRPNAKKNKKLNEFVGLISMPNLFFLKVVSQILSSPSRAFIPLFLLETWSFCMFQNVLSLAFSICIILD